MSPKRFKSYVGMRVYPTSFCGLMAGPMNRLATSQRVTYNRHTENGEMKMPEWIECATKLPSASIIVETKVEHGDAGSQTRRLRRFDTRWFEPGSDVFVEHQPTHWRQVPEAVETYRRRGFFKAFVWTEAMGEYGPVERYYNSRLDNGAPLTSYLAVRDKEHGGDAQQVWDGCVVVSDETGYVLAMSKEDFDAEYEPV